MSILKTSVPTKPASLLSQVSHFLPKEYRYLAHRIGGHFYSGALFAGTVIKSLPHLILDAPSTTYAMALSTYLFTRSEEEKNDPYFMQPLVLQYPHLIKHASKELKDSIKFMAPLVDAHPELIEHASVELQKNPAFMRDTIGKKSELIAYAAQDLKNDKNLFKSLLKTDPTLIRHASIEIKNDPAVMEPLVIDKPDLIRYSTTLRKDDQFMPKVIRENEQLIEYIDESLKSNSAFMKKMVEFKIDWISKVSGKLRGDLDFMKFVATLDSFTAKKYADAKLKENPEFTSFIRDVEFMEVALSKPSFIKHCEERFKNNETFMLKAIKKDPELYHFATATLKADPSFGEKAFRLAPELVEPILTNCPDLYDNEEFMLAAIEKNPIFYDRASDTLKNTTSFAKKVFEVAPRLVKTILTNCSDLHSDESIMLAAIEEDSSLYHKATADLKNTRSFAEKTISLAPQLLQSIIENCSDLNNDEEFMLNTIKEFPHFYQIASEELKENLLFGGKVILANSKAIEFAPEKLRTQEPIINCLIKQDISLVKHMSANLTNSVDKMRPFIEMNPEILKWIFPLSKKILETSPKILEEILKFTFTDEKSLSQEDVQMLMNNLRLELTGTNEAIYIKHTKTLVEFLLFLKNLAITDAKILQFVDPYLLNNESFMSDIVSKNDNAKEYCSKALLETDTFKFLLNTEYTSTGSTPTRESGADEQ